MTIKELAEFCNRDTKTVRRWVKKVYSGQNVQSTGDKMSSGIKDKNLMH